MDGSVTMTGPRDGHVRHGRALSTGPRDRCILTTGAPAR